MQNYFSKLLLLLSLLSLNLLALYDTDIIQVTVSNYCTMEEGNDLAVCIKNLTNETIDHEKIWLSINQEDDDGNGSGSFYVFYGNLRPNEYIIVQTSREKISELWNYGEISLKNVYAGEELLRFHFNALSVPMKMPAISELKEEVGNYICEWI